MTLKKIEPNEIIDGLKKMGLSLDRDDMNEIDPSAIYKLKLKNYKTAQSFKKAFSTAAGQEVLDALMDQSLRKIAWHWSAETTDKALLYGLHRQGQDSIMQFILEQIALAEAGPPVQKSPGKTAQ